MQEDKWYKGTEDGLVEIHHYDFTWEPLPRRLDVRNHSPTGFNWGYVGSGPAQLALAIMCDLLPHHIEKARMCYQAFKRDVIARLPQGKEFTLHATDCLNWLRDWERESFDAAWEFLADDGVVEAEGTEQYRRTLAAFWRAGAPVDGNFFNWLAIEANIGSTVITT